MQSLLKAMNRDLQGLWIARLERDPLLVSGLLLPVWCVGARTRFLMTRCTIPTFVNVFAGNLFIRLTYIIYEQEAIQNLFLNVGMAQKGQKQEGMSCGEVHAVCGFHTLGYCTIYPYIWQHSVLLPVRPH